MSTLGARAAWQTLAATLFSLISVNVAAAERATVSLPQGATVSGELLEYKPGDHITLDVGTGKPLTIPADNVLSVSMGDKPAAPPPESVQSAVPVEPRDTAFTFGLGLGYALPWGKFDSDDGLSVGESVTGQVPLILDAGYRIDHFVVGMQFQYGLAFRSANKCDGGADCSTKDLRLGLTLEYRIKPHEPIDPWVGIGVGYEWLSFSDTVDGRIRSGGIRGIEMFALRAGLDFQVADQLHAGPFVGFSLGQYSASWRNEGGSEDISQTALHGWITIGVRGNYELDLASR